jgi:Domain of unknown function (DUF4178)
VPDAIPSVRAIRCTKCGAPLELRSAAARTIVCRYCAAQFDLTSPDYAFLETLRRQPLAGPLEVGLGGVIDQIPYQIAGVIAWQDGEARWQDYFLVGPEGHTAWIRYDHFTYRLFQVFKPLDAEPIELQTLDPHSQFVEFGGAHYIVLDRQHARVTYLEGELPWRARMGEELVMLQCDPALSVEVSPTQVRYFRWSLVPWENLADAFGVPAEVARPDPGPMQLKIWPIPFKSAAGGVFYGGLLVVVFALAVGALALPSCPSPRSPAGDVSHARRRLGLADPALRPASP